jgi:hypothetical protein
MDILTETLNTPIEEAGDVIVFGAGSAGVAAAVAAAREGARTTLIDPSPFPGGNLVSGLPILGGYDGEKQVVRGFFQELCDALRERNGIDNDPTREKDINIDVEKLKIILLEKLLAAGVQLRGYTLLVRAVVSESRIEAAVIEGKGGRRALRAPIFIDTTGDADLAFLAGAPVEKGRPDDGLMQAMTLMFGVGNIDKTRFTEWGAYPALERRYVELAGEMGLRNPRRDSLSGMWGAQSRHGEYSFNVTRILGADGTDAASLTKAETEGRLQVLEFVERFLRPHIPGFENAYVVWTAAKIGVRETRRIVGEHVLNHDDVWNFVKFPDVINCGASPIDIHCPLGGVGEFPIGHFFGGKYWTIPYRCIVPLKIDNLLAAGRCLSATHEAMGAARQMTNCMGTGEAAGFAAALCVKENTTPRQLDPRKVQELILKHDGWLGEGFSLANGAGTSAVPLSSRVAG